MSRHFPDFLSSYMEYAVDGFCPDKFHFWTGISIVAGALERKVWIPFENDRKIFPNLYVMLVSHPGIGKSSAGNRGVMNILRKISSEQGEVNMLPAQITEARLVEVMSRWKKFYIGTKETTQSSGYFYASEASNSLKEIMGGGDIMACLTEFYDCADKWEKGTVKSGEITISNLCLNMLAGCTFDYLRQLIPARNIMGGYASRNLFIVQDERFVRSPKWNEANHDNGVMKQKLINDLSRIYTLTGAFQATPEFQAAYEKWFPEHDSYVQGLTNEKIQALLARKQTNVLKLSMIMSVIESDSMKLELPHWERALALITELEKDLPRIISASTEKDSQQEGTNLIVHTLAQHAGQWGAGRLKRKMLFSGIQPIRIDSILEYMVKNGVLELIRHGAGLDYKLLVNPKDYL